MAKLSKSLNSLILFGLSALLLACTQGAGTLGGSVEGAPSLDQVNQAGPVDRQPIITEADPIDDCSPYGQNPENYEPEEVPENCREFYEAMLNRPQRAEPEGPQVLVRVYDEIEREEDQEEEETPLTIEEQIDFEAEFQPIQFQRVNIDLN